MARTLLFFLLFLPPSLLPSSPPPPSAPPLSSRPSTCSIPPAHESAQLPPLGNELGDRSHLVARPPPLGCPSPAHTCDSVLFCCRPLIGILSQPGDGDGGQLMKRKGWKIGDVSYIAASYVKFVEAGGARVVPLIYNEPEEILQRKFGAINGILFPGGGASLDDGPFYRTAEKLFKMAPDKQIIRSYKSHLLYLCHTGDFPIEVSNVQCYSLGRRWLTSPLNSLRRLFVCSSRPNMALEANDKGDYFPVFGTCLGFELLSIIISQDHGILENFSAIAQPAPLFFTSDWAKQRNMFKWFPAKIIEKLSTECLAMENHRYGLSPQRMASNGKLSSFFHILTTSPDNNNKIYISTVEGRKYPVTGVQWHPEKNAFEWGLSTIPHSSEAIQVTQSVANFFISEARKSRHRPTSEEEQQFLIYNYDPFYTGKDGKGHFDQAYVFP